MTFFRFVTLATPLLLGCSACRGPSADHPDSVPVDSSPDTDVSLPDAGTDAFACSIEPVASLPEPTGTAAVVYDRMLVNRTDPLSPRGMFSGVPETLVFGSSKSLRLDAAGNVLGSAPYQSPSGTAGDVYLDTVIRGDGGFAVALAEASGTYFCLLGPDGSLRTDTCSLFSTLFLPVPMAWDGTKYVAVAFNPGAVRTVLFDSGGQRLGTLDLWTQQTSQFPISTITFAGNAFVMCGGGFHSEFGGSGFCNTVWLHALPPSLEPAARKTYDGLNTDATGGATCRLAASGSRVFVTYDGECHQADTCEAVDLQHFGAFASVLGSDGTLVAPPRQVPLRGHIDHRVAWDGDRFLVSETTVHGTRLFAFDEDGVLTSQNVRLPVSCEAQEVQCFTNSVALTAVAVNDYLLVYDTLTGAGGETRLVRFSLP